jgi:flagellar hook assembly protein FlgD
MRKVLIPLMVLLVAAGAFARGNQEAPPEIGVGDEETVYLSPQSSPNVQDSITIPISVTADASRNDVVVAYQIVIQNSAGQTVWTEVGADETERPGFFGRLMENLGLRDKETTVTIPESRDWDGTYLGSTVGADGAPVPDGDYTYTLSVNDSGEITGTSEPRTVVIDNTVPTATATSEYDVFSPNGDSRKDTVTLTQTTSSEDEWVGSILSSGSEVFRVEWAGSAPASYTWDGKNLAGRDLPDGEYVYQLTSTDRAGNTLTLTLPAVAIDTAARPLSLSVDNPAFSPNGDGVKDTITLDFGPVVLTRLSSASLTVSDSSGTELQSVEVGSLIGNPIVFNGYVNSAGTLRMPEGAYQVSAVANYENGTISTAGPVDVVVDITPPSASVSASAGVFSPEGDGLRDTVVVTHAVDGNDSWRGFVFIPGGEVLATFSFGDTVPRSVVWDGTDPNGAPVPDARYSYQLIGTDAAGNQTATEPIAVTVDRRATTMDIEFSRRYFSPNGDDQGDTVTVRPNLSVPTGVSRYTVTVKNSAGEVVGSGAGTGDLPASMVWDGRDLRGNILPEGDYIAELALVYEKGNQPVGVSPVLTIDNTVPSVSLRASANGFTPDGDGTDDTIRFTPRVSPAGEIVRFSGKVVSLDGRTVAQATGVTPTAVDWDGTTSSGTTVPVGGYVAVLEVEHRNGTVREARTGTIAVGEFDAMAPQVALRLSPPIFSPDGDGVDDTVTMTLAVLGGNPVGSWEISVYEPDGDLFHSFPVGDGLVRSVEWDGRNDAGELVEMAVDYDIRFEVTDAAGNVATGSEPLTIDVLTEELYGGRRILVDNVLFEGHTTRFLYWDNDAEAQNVVTLEKMGDILRKFPNYSIEIHGHAVSVLYYDAAASDREQEQVLMPLSQARSEIIRDVFVGYGADESRFSLEAWGKLRPLVPFSNLDERPINRRVEFYLVR